MNFIKDISKRSFLPRDDQNFLEILEKWKIQNTLSKQIKNILQKHSPPPLNKFYLNVLSRLGIYCALACIEVLNYSAIIKLAAFISSYLKE